jgi:hypothetical protein
MEATKKPAKMPRDEKASGNVEETGHFLATERRRETEKMITEEVRF